MTHRDIYIKFMIGYDKANVTSSYPSLTEYEVATFLDKAYLALIAQKVTGNNSRHIGFEQDLKVTEDLGPLITTKRISGIDQSPIPYVQNALACEKPDDWLYFVSGELKRGNKTWDIQLIDHNTATKFYTTAYNIPWIKRPVCYEEDTKIYTLYDSILQTQAIGNPTTMALTYIRMPNKFMIEDSRDNSTEQQNLPTVTCQYANAQGVTLTLGDSFNINYTNGDNGEIDFEFSNPSVVEAEQDSITNKLTITATSVGFTNLRVYNERYPNWSYLLYITVSPGQQVETWEKSISGPDSITGSSRGAYYSASLSSSWGIRPNILWNIYNVGGTVQQGTSYATINSGYVQVSYTATSSKNLIIRASSADDPSVYVEKQISVLYWTEPEPEETWELSIVQDPNGFENNQCYFYAEITSNLGNTYTPRWTVYSGQQFITINQDQTDPGKATVVVSSNATITSAVVIRVFAQEDNSVYDDIAFSVLYEELNSNWLFGDLFPVEFIGSSGSNIYVTKWPSELAWVDLEDVEIHSATVDTMSPADLPALRNENGVVVQYSSSDTSVATINQTTGQITIVGTGSTQITATFAGSDTFYADEVKYTLNVQETWTISGEGSFFWSKIIDPQTGLFMKNKMQFIYSATSSFGRTSSLTYSLLDGSDYFSLTPTGLFTIFLVDTQAHEFRVRVTVDEDPNIQLDLTRSVSCELTYTGYSMTGPDYVYNADNQAQYIGIYKDDFGNNATSFYSIASGGEYAEIDMYTGLLTVKQAATDYQPVLIDVMCWQDPLDSLNQLSMLVNVKYYDQSQIVLPNISWDRDQCTISDSSNYSTPILSNPNNVQVTYQSSNQSIATVSSAGVVTPISNGQCTISAVSTQTNDYGSQTVSYTLNVSIQSFTQMLTYPIGVDSDANMYPTVASYPASYTHQILQNGSASMVIKTNGNNLGNLSVTTSGTSFKYTPLIENWGFMVVNTGGWRGGTTSAANEYGTVTVSAQNDTNNVYRKSYKFYSNIDENNTRLLSGDFCTKFIRIPAAGMTASSYIEKYPYTFFNNMYSAIEQPLVLDHSTRTASSLPIYINNTDGDFIESISVSQCTAITSKIDFQIAENTTQQYRDALIKFDDFTGYDPTDSTVVYNYAATNGSVTIHFVQEYRSQNRIYYGPSGQMTGKPKYIDATNDQNSQNKDYVFQLANSKVINDTFTVRSSNEWASRDYTICYPADMDQRFNITVQNASTDVTQRYTWGDQEYIIRRLNHASLYPEITFTKIS